MLYVTLFEDEITILKEKREATLTEQKNWQLLIRNSEGDKKVE